jgi:hypothetical protein
LKNSQALLEENKLGKTPKASNNVGLEYDISVSFSFKDASD